MKNSNFSKPLLYLGFICLLFNLFSCSVTFEKRRYRPGYHVDVVGNHKTPNNEINERSITVKESTLTPLLIKDSVRLKKTNPVVEVSVNNFLKQPKITISNSPSFKKDSKKVNLPLHSVRQAKKLGKILETKKTNVLTGRKIAAWIIGGVAMVLLICAIAYAISGGFSGWGIAIIFFAIALILSIIALLVRFIGAKKQAKIERDELAYKPKNKTFFNASFILAIITLSLALIGFILSFLIYPFGLIGFSVCIIALVASVVSICFGFRALKDDKSLKTKLAIIFGFIALVLASFGVAFLFL